MRQMDPQAPPRPNAAPQGEGSGKTQGGLAPKKWIVEGGVELGGIEPPTS